MKCNILQLDHFLILKYIILKIFNTQALSVVYTLRK